MTRPQATQSPLRVLISMIDMLLGLAQDQPEQRQEPRLALALDCLSVSQSTYRVAQTRCHASADLLGLASCLRNESGHNLRL